MRRFSLLLIATYLGLSTGSVLAADHPELLTRLFDYDCDEVLRVCGALRPGERPPAQASSPLMVEQSTGQQTYREKKKHAPLDDFALLIEGKIIKISNSSMSSFFWKSAPTASFSIEQADAPSMPAAPPQELGKEPSEFNQSLPSQCAELAASLRYEEQNYKDNGRRAETDSLNADKLCVGVDNDASCQSKLQEAQMHSQLALKNLSNTQTLEKKCLILDAWHDNLRACLKCK